jgi:hypothetical protein
VAFNKSAEVENMMKSLDIAPVHEQTVASDRRARIWSAMTAIAFIVAAGLIANALDVANFIQAGLTTEPPKAHAADIGAERGGVWRHYELMY